MLYEVITDRFAYGAAEALGISPVLMPLTDVMTGLQTELIDTIMTPPVAAIVLQWNTKVSYITQLPLSYIFAMIAIDKKYFDRIQPADQAIVREVLEKIYRGFDQQGNEDNVITSYSIHYTKLYEITIAQVHFRWAKKVYIPRAWPITATPAAEPMESIEPPTPAVNVTSNH